MNEILKNEEIQAKLRELIFNSKESLIIVNSAFSMDNPVMDLIVEARKRMIDVEIITRAYSRGKNRECIDFLLSHGVQFRFYQNITAKILIADNQKAFMFSNSFNLGTIQNYQNIGFYTEDEQLISSLQIFIEELKTKEPVLLPQKEELKTKEPVLLPQKAEQKVQKKKKKEVPNLSVIETKYFIKLKKWRFAKAQKLDLEPYKIAHDVVLKRIVQARPRSQEDLEAIYGFGKVLAARHGKDILKIIKPLKQK